MSSDASSHPDHDGDWALLAGKRVLICEDEALTVLQLRRVLTRAGMRIVGEWRSGDECVDAAVKEDPDIVLMDIGLYGTDGVEATRQILAKEKTCVILLTGQANAVLNNAKATGAAGVITKPVTGDLLLPQLADCFRNHHAGASDPPA